MSEFQVAVSKLPQVDDTHRHHLRLAVLHLQQPIAHQVRTWIYAQYDLLHIGCKDTKITADYADYTDFFGINR